MDRGDRRIRSLDPNQRVIIYSGSCDPKTEAARSLPLASPRWSKKAAHWITLRRLCSMRSSLPTLEKKGCCKGKVKDP